MSERIEGGMIKGRQIARGMYEVEERGFRAASPPKAFIDRVLHYAPSAAVRQKLWRQLSKMK